MSLTQRFVEYLKAYENKDINTISKQFSETVLLRDWKISVTGKRLAVEETEKNFAAGGNISINVLRTFEDKSTVVAELYIVVEGSEELYVTDIATYNEFDQITTLRAYLGRED